LILENNIKIAVIGLGYVGLPLAHLFASKYPVVGFDINTTRIESLRKGEDTTLELSNKELVSVIKTENTNSKGLAFTSNTHEIEECNYYMEI